MIYAVEVTGNRATSTDFILREMTLKPGMSANAETIESDRLRLESLGLFNRVDMKTVSDQGRALLIVTVTEPWYIYLFPIVRWDPYNPDRRLLGGGLYHRNFRGYGEQVGLFGWSGYETGLFLTHDDPWFRFGGKYGLDGSLYYLDRELTAESGTIHRQKIQYMEATVRRRIDYTARVELSLAWEERTSDLDSYTFSSNNKDQLIVGKLYLRNDKRDYRYYPSAGCLLQATLEGNYLIGESHNFIREQLEYRRYRAFGSVILAGRLMAAFSHGETPYYRQILISNQYIRSGYDFDDYGEIAVTANLELRFPLVKLRYFSFDQIPIAGKYLHNLKFSVEGLLFADKGFGQHKDGVKRNHDLWAYGCGLQFQLPYVMIAHIIFGWKPDDDISNPAFMLRNGVTF